MDKLKIRASQLGLFMSKSGKLIQGGKTEALKLWLKHQYGYDEIVTSPAMTKGTELEADAIEIVQKVLGGEKRINSDIRAMLCAGKKYTNDQKAVSFGYYNDYLTGSPDVILKDAIEDIKVSMNIRTFYEAELTDLYEWQLQAYMWLTGRKKARLIYVAMPDPDWMVMSKVGALTYQVRDEDMIAHYADQIRHNAKCVLKLPLEKRIKVFNVEYSQEKIEQIKSIVNQVREYCQTLDNA
jgi:CRISPR/Cas system-associated exonuclease Cas4 (RecB family)